MELRLLLQLMCWQDWLFSLAYFDAEKDHENGTRYLIYVLKGNII